MKNNNVYLPFPAKILKVIKHTEIEYTFRMEYHQRDVKPGQFFEISIPKFGEAPISVSGIQEGSLDFTIRKVGKVTDEIFEHYEGGFFFLRGPYGNGFDVNDYKDNELVVIAGGTGVSPVRGVVDYFSKHSHEIKKMTFVAGFKTPSDILFLEDFSRWKQNMDIILTVDCGEDSVCNIGLVTDYIPKLKIDNVQEALAIVVGPLAMMKFSVQGLLDYGFQEKNIWISHERKMCCGVGKCGHCKINDQYVCLDGPVFNYTIGKSLVD
ncbi:MAG: anaerobic sulfite reductase subunit AsrB [Breznakia sp.]